MPTRSLLMMLAVCWAQATAAELDGDCPKVVVSADPDYPPLHWYDGKELRGPSIDLATRILSDLKIPYEVRYVGPWKRVLANASIGKIDLVATLKIQPERERYLDFVRTPAFPNPVAVFVPRQRAFIFNTWQDLASHKGGIALGNTFGQEFSQFAAANLRLEESGTADSNFRKLGLGRIDYFVSGLFTGEAWLARHGRNAQIVAMRPFLAEDKNYYAFSKFSPCTRHLDAFEARLKELVANKTNIAMLNASLQDLDVKLDSATLGRK
ncbi:MULTISPECIES: ABC transporter substrate-binding protein [unclassified Duganella]|uniref:substrate-binding periplasmic protein n=1 Tax=unclassified Duganella TaxID=2636909 RepID=UPI000E355ABC|nr:MULTISPECIES: transporter substrate-binding domain-containing protein [unclassified Duganella]RFP10087.1 amino acid-binding protein [Duganella sp. BJB475]RFP25607.1 amino acid-binding protein [Duganella sp. BJB476]